MQHANYTSQATSTPDHPDCTVQALAANTLGKIRIDGG